MCQRRLGVALVPQAWSLWSWGHLSCAGLSPPAWEERYRAEEAEVP